MVVDLITIAIIILFLCIYPKIQMKVWLREVNKFLIDKSQTVKKEDNERKEE